MTDTKYIDFAEVKRRVSLHQCVTMLGLDLKQSGNQYRGACPVHGGGPRTFVITPGKGFFCFAEKKGGDQIGMVAHVRQISNREAAEAITKHYGLGILPEPKDTAPPAQTRKEKGFDPETYAARLDPAHEALAGLAISPEILRSFGAGYASSGVNRGRLALPLCDRNGEFVCYFGRTLKDESPALIFPNGVNPHAHIFNAHNVKEGDVYLVSDPVAVLQAAEQGIENVVAFLTPISAQQLEQLASLMDERKCETVELY